MKYLLAFLLAALALAGAWGWQGQNAAKEARAEASLYQGRLQASEAAVEALVQSAKKNEIVLVARAKKAEARATTLKKDNRALQEALDANRDWADQPVPSGVFDALRGQGGNPEGVPTRVPIAPLP